MPNPTSFIAINEFLDNPLFFYGHQDLFANGIGAFDRVADEVNHIEPDTRWRSLGDMAKHLYMVRLRDDANYDVLAFSSTLDSGEHVETKFNFLHPEAGIRFFRDRFRECQESSRCLFNSTAECFA